ncbi:unnamed protein product, partial [Prorocentrum cordatum]
PLGAEPALQRARGARAAGRSGSRRRRGAADGGLSACLVHDTVEVVQFDDEGGPRTISRRTASPRTSVPRCSARQAKLDVDSGTPGIVEGLQFDVEIAGTHDAKATGGSRISGTFLPQSPLDRQTSWGTSSTSDSLLETHCSISSLSKAALDDSETEEVVEETLFAKAAQMRRIRRSVTANSGPGLPSHALPATTMSRILSRRRGPSLNVHTN